jgi:phosphatidylinositol phospholipase C beta
VEQTKQWTDLLEKHRREEWEMMKSHLQAQEDILRKLMEVSHANQLKQLDAKHERYEKL